jgi:hypothetical protein
MRVDGHTTDFIPADEDIFRADPVSGLPQESSTDSPWGANEEIYQIRVTWDSQFLYVAVEGKIWGNNMVLLMDTVPNRGLQDMTVLTSWRRNITFDAFGRTPGDEFLPDVFGATWDTNLNPRFITQISEKTCTVEGDPTTCKVQVNDQVVGPYFRASSTFDQGNDARSMEFAIPWNTVFAGIAGVGTRDTFITVGGIADTLRRMPNGVHGIKLCAVLTGGGDGTGGPDSAPDNLRGHTNDGNANIVVDNYAYIDLDQNDDTGMGAGGPDGIPDWGVSPLERVRFRYPPPVVPLRFFIDNMTFDRPAFAPDPGDKMHFHLAVKPVLNPADPIDQVRQVRLSAGVYDIKGRMVRTLFRDWNSLALNLDDKIQAADKGVWDGRDDSGAKVPPGIYIVRVVMEPNLDRATRAVVVVR